MDVSRFFLLLSLHFLRLSCMALFAWSLGIISMMFGLPQSLGWSVALWVLSLILTLTKRT